MHQVSLFSSVACGLVALVGWNMSPQDEVTQDAEAPRPGVVFTMASEMEELAQRVSNVEGRVEFLENELGRQKAQLGAFAGNNTVRSNGSTGGLTASYAGNGSTGGVTSRVVYSEPVQTVQTTRPARVVRSGPIQRLFNRRGTSSSQCYVDQYGNTICR